MERLLSEPDGAPPPVIIETVAESSGDVFADLERELRAFKATTPSSMQSDEAVETVVLAELEGWLRVLRAERTSLTA
jgi:hypothetical protein